MFPVYALVSSLEGRDRAHVYTHTHTNIHISHIKQQAVSTLHQKKNSILKNFTVAAKYVYLYSYHLAALPFSWILIKLSNVKNYVKIVMYIQFGMLTWYKN